MKTETSRVTQTPDDVLNELRALVSEAEKILERSPRASDESESTLARLQERFEAAQERLANAAQATKQRVVAGAKYTDRAIRDHPYQSLAIALGVGVLAGILIGRRSHSSAK